MARRDHTRMMIYYYYYYYCYYYYYYYYLFVISRRHHHPKYDSKFKTVELCKAACIHLVNNCDAVNYDKSVYTPLSAPIPSPRLAPCAPASVALTLFLTLVPASSPRSRSHPHTPYTPSSVACSDAHPLPSYTIEWSMCGSVLIVCVT